MIKKILFCSVFGLYSLTSFAEVNTCKEISEVALEAQLIRQTGASLQEAVEIVGDKDIVIRAYLFPLGETLKEKESVISYFTTFVFNICMEELEKRK